MQNVLAKFLGVVVVYLLNFDVLYRQFLFCKLSAVTLRLF